MRVSDFIQKYADTHIKAGRCGYVFSEDGILYDFGYHYPLAIITDIIIDGKILVCINVSGYSVTTAKHIGYARYAFNSSHAYTVLETDTEGMKILKDFILYGNDRRELVLFKDHAIKRAKRDIEANENKRLRARNKQRYDDEIDNIYSDIGIINSII